MKKLMMIITLLLVVGLLVSVSCARTPSESKDLGGGAVVMPAPMPPTPSIVPGVPGRDVVGGSSGGLASVAQERMIVRNGDMSLVVNDVVEARDEIVSLAVRLDGYVVSSFIYGEGREMRGSISIRVPDDKFDQALMELRTLAVRVNSDSTNSQDVTEQYVDLAARLKNAEATEQQYLALMNRATDVEDMLRIQDSLSRVRQDIEQIKGQMQYLERTSAMSLITVQLQPSATAKPLVPVEWSAAETLKSAIRGIVTFGQWLVDIVIWVLILLPVWGTVVGIVYWYWHRRHRQKVQ